MEEFEELVLPGGTFRRYVSRPDVWVQVDGGPTVPEKIMEHYLSGNAKK